jgi:hypothetical protein
MVWLFSLVIILIIEIKYKPRLDVIKNEYLTSFIVFYSVRTKEGFIRREFFELFNLKNNDW